MANDIFDAARNNNIEEIAKFIDGGIAVDAVTNKGNTALMYAVNKGCVNAVNFLLEMGADVNFKGSEGVTALMYAVDAVQLNELGSEVSLSQKFIQKITLDNAVKVSQILVEGGADVNVKDEHGKNALIYSLESEEILNKIITTTLASPRINNREYFNDFISQLADENVQFKLTQESVMFLAVMLPEGEVRSSIIVSYNSRSSKENALDFDEIEKLRAVKVKLNAKEDLKDDESSQNIALMELSSTPNLGDKKLDVVEDVLRFCLTEELKKENTPGSSAKSRKSKAFESRVEAVKVDSKNNSICCPSWW